MQTSFIIKQEYFALIKKLNEANKHKNQETEVYFYLDLSNPDELRLFAAISDSQKILLCYKVIQSKWVQAQFSQVPNLEEFIARLLMLYEGNDTPDLTKYIKSHIFKLTN